MVTLIGHSPCQSWPTLYTRLEPIRIAGIQIGACKHHEICKRSWSHFKCDSLAFQNECNNIPFNKGTTEMIMMMVIIIILFLTCPSFLSMPWCNSFTRGHKLCLVHWNSGRILYYFALYQPLLLKGNQLILHKEQLFM